MAKKIIKKTKKNDCVECGGTGIGSPTGDPCGACQGGNK